MKVRTLAALCAAFIVPSLRADPVVVYGNSATPYAQQNPDYLATVTFNAGVGTLTLSSNTGQAMTSTLAYGDGQILPLTLNVTAVANGQQTVTFAVGNATPLTVIANMSGSILFNQAQAQQNSTFRITSEGGGNITGLSMQPLGINQLTADHDDPNRYAVFAQIRQANLMNGYTENLSVQASGLTNNASFTGMNSLSLSAGGDIVPVPEPQTWIMPAALAVIACYRGRRRRIV